MVESTKLCWKDLGSSFVYDKLCVILIVNYFDIMIDHDEW